MNYSKVDFDRLLASTPIDKKAQSVIGRSAEVEDRESFADVRDRLLGYMTKERYFRKSLTKKDPEFIESLARECRFKQEYDDLMRRNPAARMKKRAKSNYILDVCKEVMSREMFAKCVDEGVRRMKLDIDDGRSIDLENKRGNQ